MARVESLRCPNCGGTVTGKGEITCQYCGSKLTISKPKSESDGDALTVMFSQRTDAIGSFSSLPNVPIYTKSSERI